MSPTDKGYRLVDGDPRMRRKRRMTRKPLRPGASPAPRTALTRSTPLRPGPWRKPGTEERSNGRAPFAASEAQRAKILGAACVVCQQTTGITPAHRRRAL